MANALVGTIYILLAMCFGELSSIVPFAGGSFGYCRASLGPFWGFMVGASEMLENLFFVSVSVLVTSKALTAVCETDDSLQPMWFFVLFTLIFGVHLRGGALFWYSIIACGLVSVVLIFLYCSVGMQEINVEKWGTKNGQLFMDSEFPFFATLYRCTFFYFGIEVVPQTCERVKNVSQLGSLYAC